MSRSILGFIAVVAVSACSSSSNPCSAYQSLDNAIASSSAACAGDAGSATFNITNCNTFFSGSACSADDVTALETNLSQSQSCVSTIPACTIADAGGWGTALTACASGASDSGITQTCADGLADAGVTLAN